jgi:ActR/RegA family two-component response regulator
MNMSDEIQVEGEELPHLLLVDDDATFTRVMARAMSRRGFASVPQAPPKKAWPWPRPTCRTTPRWT